MNYKGMNDFEINLLVAKLTLEFEDITTVPMMGMSVRWSDGANWHHFNPCNSWADAGPIIKNNRIPIHPVASYWQAGFGMDKPLVADENPLRAAMIVFLMMQESK